MCQNGLTVYVDFYVVVYLSSVTSPSHQVGGAVTVTREREDRPLVLAASSAPSHPVNAG